MRTIVQADHLFLPVKVKELLSAMYKLRPKFNDLARRNAVPRISPIAEVYPNNPVHTMENVYRADKQKDSQHVLGHTTFTSILFCQILTAKFPNNLTRL